MSDEQEDQLLTIFSGMALPLKFSERGLYQLDGSGTIQPFNLGSTPWWSDGAVIQAWIDADVAGKALINTSNSIL